MATRKSNTGVVTSEQLKDLIVQTLDDNKAEQIETINLQGLTSLADYMVVATGTSSRLVASLADKIHEKLVQDGGDYSVLRTEGLPQADWVVVDCGDVIVHLFRPEVRDFYNIEKMWRTDLPATPAPKPRSAPSAAARRGV